MNKEKMSYHKGFHVDQLEAVFKKIQDTEHWKNAITCKCHHSQVAVVLAAIEFYHADNARVVGIEEITGWVVIEGNGYQAW